MIAYAVCNLIIALGLFAVSSSIARAAPETVYFKSADGKTEIVGYLFRPTGAGPHPAVVMLHGRAGPYSANENGNCSFVARGVTSPCNATTLSKRHEMWGAYWADQGYVALLPDSFGPRGKAHGFGRFTHDDPDRESVNERTVRPLDAEGALAYLLSRRDVAPKQVYLQGWSNGASTTLNVMIRQGKGPRLSRRSRLLSWLWQGIAACTSCCLNGPDRDVLRRVRRRGVARDLPACRRPLARGRHRHRCDFVSRCDA